ncbi:Titin [Eufriesea mexicana]|uniref:Titin n=1 Tax=Eufriesea mexicana TaxID=516756 RepID=A0A310SPN3_9HYME|nr:Titin [Eufriesea mexicana]
MRRTRMGLENEQIDILAGDDRDLELAYVTGYITEKRPLIGKVQDRRKLSPQLDTATLRYCIENLKENEFLFRIFAENSIGLSLQTHGSKRSLFRGRIVTIVVISWGRSKSEGGAPLEGYRFVIRVTKKTMWMEEGRLNIKDSQENHLIMYLIRTVAKNDGGISDPSEFDEPVKIVSTNESIGGIWGVDAEEGITDQKPNKRSSECNDILTMPTVGGVCDDHQICHKLEILFDDPFPGRPIFQRVPEEKRSLEKNLDKLSNIPRDFGNRSNQFCGECTANFSDKDFRVMAKTSFRNKTSHRSNSVGGDLGDEKWLEKAATRVVKGKRRNGERHKLRPGIRIRVLTKLKRGDTRRAEKIAKRGEENLSGLDLLVQGETRKRMMTRNTARREMEAGKNEREYGTKSNTSGEIGGKRGERALRLNKGRVGLLLQRDAREHESRSGENLCIAQLTPAKPETPPNLTLPKALVFDGRHNAYVSMPKDVGAM